MSYTLGTPQKGRTEIPINSGDKHFTSHDRLLAGRSGNWTLKARSTASGGKALLLDNAGLELLRDLLQDPSTRSGLIELMVSVDMGRPARDVASQIIDAAASVGLVTTDQATPVLTNLGQKVGDSLREYLFWEQRNRTIHYDGQLRGLDDHVFAGKRVLEIGCGAGCNLLALQDTASAITGVDVEPVYIQMAPVIGEIAGLRAPAMQVASSDAMPIEDASQDVVLVLGAFQFMEFAETLLEVRRVLAPGGVFITIFSPLDLYIGAKIAEARSTRSVKCLLRAIWDIVNTLHEGMTGRRLRWLEKRGPMYQVVHPTRRRMRRLLLEAGLLPDDALTMDCAHERIYVARKQNAQTA